MDLIAVVEIAIKRSTLAVAFTVLALAQPGQCFAQESSKSTRNAEQTKMIELEGISNWLRGRFSQSELEALRPGELRVESHYCSCNDVPRKHFPYAMDIGNVPALINRVTYTGDLGYEIWVAPEYQRRLYQEIVKAGASKGIINFGMRALLAMRLEKNFPTWYRELRPIYGGFEAGMDRFIDLTKNDFIGRDAAMEEKRTGGKLRRVSMIVDAGDADVLGDEPISHKGKVVGWVTSGGFAHFVNKSMAQGYVPRELADDLGNGAFEIEIIGEQRKATIIVDPPFDPKGERMRS